MNEEILRSQLNRAIHKIAVLENMVEDKTRELYLALQESQKSERFLHDIAAAMPVAVLVFNSKGVILHANRTAEKLLGYQADKLSGIPVARCFVAGELPGLVGGSVTTYYDTNDEPLKVEAHCLSQTGEEISTLISAVPVGSEDDTLGLTAVTIVDLREQHQREADLRQAQKLETLGRLTAGVAHEINTPAQYVSDSLHFLTQAIDGLGEVIGGYQQTIAKNLSDDQADVLRIRELEDEVDSEYILENGPAAVSRAIEGLDRISGICRSIKEFSHSHAGAKSAENLNRRIVETLDIARNEYKYVADVDTDLADIPLVECHGDELAQVLLNLVVNAAHAIAEKNSGSNERGQIMISSYCDDGEVRISVADTGSGIPSHLQARVFEAFFTTKRVGHGSGQGLALAKATIEERHGGRLSVNSEVGKGTEFVISLPVNETQMEAAL